MKTIETRVIENPLIKDRVTFLETAAETNGKFTLVQVELAPDGGNELHYHKTFDETFTVVEGVLGIQLGKEIFHLKKGESATAPVGSLHRFFNPSATEKVVFNVLLQVLDDGRLTDGQGRTVDFRNTLIIMTSNLGSEYLVNQKEGEDTDAVRHEVMGVVKSHIRPEFLNRVDEIITFKPLSLGWPLRFM